MQKIRTLTFAAAGLLAGVSAWAVETVSIDQGALEKCFSEPERLDRLGCYDRLLGRPGVDDAADSAATVGSVPNRETPPAVAFVERFLSSPTITAKGVHVTLVNRSTGDALQIGKDADLSVLKTGGDDGVFNTLDRDADIYLALRNLGNTKADGALLVSCENNITRMRIKWDTPFETTTIPARFLFGDTLADESGVGRTLRVGGQGYLLESARGLESIRLLRKMIEGPRVQISAGRGQAMRSLFFDANALRDALPMVGRHCSWKVGSV